MPKEHTLSGITREATERTSLALLKLTGEGASVKFSRIETGKVQEIYTIIDPESIIAGVYLPVAGDVPGASIMIFPQTVAYLLCDMLLKKTHGTTRILTELDISALKEVGNIVLGNILTVFANNLDIKVIEKLPEFSLDMFGAVIDQVIAQFSQQTEDVLFIELVFEFNRAIVKGYVVIIFGAKEMEVLIKDL